MSSLNWARLLSQDRCKDIGVPWTEEEAKAVYKDKIPAEYVRAGVKTKKKYRKVKEEEEATGEKEVRFMSRSELVAILGEYETELTILAETPTAVVREAVTVAIKNGTKLTKTEEEEEEEEEEETEEEEEEEETEEEEEEEEEDQGVEVEDDEIKEQAIKSKRSRGRKRSRS